MIGACFIISPNRKAMAASFNPSTFQWGVTMRPYAIGSYSTSKWSTQISKAHSLGVGWARVMWDYNCKKPFTENTQVIKALNKKHINTMLVIEHNPNDGNNNLYQQGYNEGKSIAKYYKGTVHYYQLMNEGGAQSIKSPTSNGQTVTDYNVAAYNQVRDFMKGLSDGITAGDPTAIKVVTISWTQVGFLDRIVKDGVNFNVIGLDWYDWMGSFASARLSNGKLLSDKLRSYGKPLIFAEVAAMPNASNKKNVNTANQQNFTMQTAQWAWDNRGFVRGFYAFELVDNATNPNPDYYGLISVIQKKSKFVLSKVRPVYTAYEKFIKTHKP
jgi:hypothetical protein